MDKEEIRTFVASRLEGTPYYLTDVQLQSGGKIEVEIDSDEPVSIDFCVELTRAIEEAFAPAIDDYDLEVGSAGLTSPFKVKRQYEKNVGNDVEVLTTDGRKLHGVLEEAGSETFSISIVEKVKPEGAKKKVEQTRIISIPYADVKMARYDLKF